MKSLVILLSIVPFIASSQSKKVQFEIDSSLYWEAQSAVLVLEANGKSDTLEFDSHKSKVFEIKEPCTGYLVLTDDEFWYRECSFSILELKEDSLLLLVTEGRNAQPIFLTWDALQATQTVYLTLSITTYVSKCRIPGHSRLSEVVQLSGGIREPIGGTPVIRGNRGSSGVNIDPKSFKKPVPVQETGLPGVAPEFENEIPNKSEL